MAERCSECHDIGWVLRGAAPARVERCECRSEPAPPASPAAAALERYLPEGFAIGDDATAELAVELARAESELAALRERVEALEKALREADKLLGRWRTVSESDWLDVASSTDTFRAAARKLLEGK